MRSLPYPIPSLPHSIETDTNKAMQAHNERMQREQANKLRVTYSFNMFPKRFLSDKVNPGCPQS